MKTVIEGGIYGLALFSAVTCEAAQTKRPNLALTPHTPGAYELLETKALAIDRKEVVDGWGYIISGGAVLAISIPAYYLSKDVFAQVVYSAGQTLAVGAITYGASMVMIDNEYMSFYRVIQSAPNLSMDNKEVLAESFLKETGNKARQGRKIRVVFHSLTAALNFVNGATTSSADLRAALYFLGGINTLAAINYIFRPSDEEKLADSLSAPPKSHVTLEPMIGPVVGLQLHW